MANIADEFSRMSLSGKSAVELTTTAATTTAARHSKSESSNPDISYIQIHQYTGYFCPLRDYAS